MSEKTRITREPGSLSDKDIKDLIEKHHGSRLLSPVELSELIAQGKLPDDVPGRVYFDSFRDFKRYLTAEAVSAGFGVFERQRILKENIRHELQHALAARAIDPSCELAFGVVHLRDEDGGLGYQPFVNIGEGFSEEEERKIASAPDTMSHHDKEQLIARQSL